MTELAYVLPGRPQSWKRTGGKGRVKFTDPEMRRFKRIHMLAAQAAASKVRWVVDEDAEYELEVLAFMKDRRSLPDWDNLGKLISDAIEGVAYANDRQVSDGVVRRRIDRERPRTEVRVRRRAE